MILAEWGLYDTGWVRAVWYWVSESCVYLEERRCASADVRRHLWRIALCEDLHYKRTLTTAYVGSIIMLINPLSTILHPSSNLLTKPFHRTPSLNSLTKPLHQGLITWAVNPFDSGSEIPMTEAAPNMHNDKDGKDTHWEWQGQTTGNDKDNHREW